MSNFAYTDSFVKKGCYINNFIGESDHKISFTQTNICKYNRTITAYKFSFIWILCVLQLPNIALHSKAMMDSFPYQYTGHI